MTRLTSIHFPGGRRGRGRLKGGAVPFHDASFYETPRRSFIEYSHKIKRCYDAEEFLRASPAHYQ